MRLFGMRRQTRALFRVHVSMRDAMRGVSRLALSRFTVIAATLDAIYDESARLHEDKMATKPGVSAGWDREITELN